MADWKKAGESNHILEGDGFYVSYNPSPGKMLGISVPLWGSDGGSSETALVTENPNQYLILNGDFRKEYEAVIDKGFSACVTVFNELKDKHESTWSIKGSLCPT